MSIWFPYGLLGFVGPSTVPEELQSTSVKKATKLLPPPFYTHVSTPSPPLCVSPLLQIDTLPEELRAKAVKKATKLLHQTLAVTKFGKAPVIPVAAKPGAWLPQHCPLSVLFLLKVA
jgi:hypothetical protein